LKKSNYVAGVAVWVVIILFFTGLWHAPFETEFDWIYFFKSFLDWKSWCNIGSLVGGIGLFLFSLAGFFIKEEDAVDKAGRIMVKVLHGGAIIWLLLSIGMIMGGSEKWC
jgi:hypothetical protein